jgi:undecaprenyl-diphosphatase
MVAATVIGGGTHQAALCLIFVLAGFRWRRANWRAAGYAGMAAAAMSTVAVQICKLLWNRPRPLLAMFDVRVLDKPLFAHSFPSGHTMTAFAVAVACSIFVPRLRYVLIPFACLTGISRIYVGAHFPIDVIFGGLVGVFLGLLGAAIVRRWSNSKGEEAEVRDQS